MVSSPYHTDDWNLGLDAFNDHEMVAVWGSQDKARFETVQDFGEQHWVGEVPGDGLQAIEKGGFGDLRLGRYWASCEDLPLVSVEQLFVGWGDAPTFFIVVC